MSATPVGNEPPDPVDDIQAEAGDQQTTISWVNPFTPDLDRVLVVRNTDHPPRNPSDGDEAYHNDDPSPGEKESFTDAGLQNGVTYYYAIFTFDDDGNWTRSGAEWDDDLTLTPQLGVPEGFVGVTPQPVTPDGCIFWFVLPGDTVVAHLMLFDVDGALLANISLDPGARRYPDSGRWVPEDSDGRLLGSGLYLWVIEIQHTDGSVTYSQPEKLVIVR